MLQPALQKNDRQAYWLIGIFSFVVFTAVAILSRISVNIHPGFNVHIFAFANAIINSIIAVLLVAAFVAVRSRRFILHKNLMLTALVLSVLFLISYIAHHLLAGEALYGDADHNGVLTVTEKAAVASTRTFYLIILLTHIFLAAVILPFILYTAYRALTSEFALHKKIARYTWPLWLYVSVTGPLVYYMIKPYYH